MTTRELHREEWPRLKGTDLEDLVALRPDSVACVVVVEDRDGAIVGSWALATFLHAEGVNIHPAHQKAAAVPKLLLAGMRRALRFRGIDGVLTGANTPDVAKLLDKLGAVPVMTTYYWPQRTQAERIGATFHRTFEKSVGHAPDHPPMPHHDRAVGESITRAFAGEIREAETDYNVWAKQNGFEQATFQCMTDDGRMVVTSGPYEFTISSSGYCEARTVCPTQR